MGMFGFGKPKERPIPPGEGEGPDFTAPDPLIPGPYIHPGQGYAPVNMSIPEQWAMYNHYDSPPTNAPASDWAKYDNSRTETYTDEWSNAEPQLTHVHTKSKMPDVRWIPVAPSYPTHAPSTYRFLRAFDSWAARHLTGEHFSMATNDRTYNIGGMTPARERGRRNTYRLSPEPWDENIVDRVTPAQPVNGTYISSESTGSGTRAYRLG